MKWRPDTPQLTRESPTTLALRIAVRALKAIEQAANSNQFGLDHIGKLASAALFEIAELIQ